MADVSAALDTVGAAPQSPFGLKVPTPAVDFQSGIKRLGELGAERQSAVKGYEKDAAGIQDKIGAERKAASDLTVPKLENVEEEFKGRGLSGEELKDTMQTMFAFAAIGGAMTRQPMTAAFNAFNGALKGLIQGDQLLFRREKDTFDRHLKTAMAKNQQAMNEYKIAFDKHRGNMQDLMNEWSILTKKHGDTVSAINMERQDIQGMLRQVESMKKIDQQMRRADQMFSLQFKRLEEQQRHNKSIEEARARDTQIRQRVADSKVVGAAGKPMTAIQATMYEDVATGFYRLDMLKEQAKEEGELPGGSPFLQSQMHNDGLVSAVRQWGINKSLPEGYQETDALLLGVAFDVASARSGGRGQLSDAKIREVTRQMPLSSDTDKVRQTKYALIENQLEAANKTLPGPYQYDMATKKQRGEAQAPGAAGVGPYPDPDKERRYQEWKAKNGQGTP